ncbi:2-dehydro-3-deoxygalactonokinase [Labrenzia sp. 011]|uniref:2-dehydro-3-deoxygalactonokinase n=1 Tax=Labrenzia sp. 011 TaxID=2171494 RepID=UPI000D524166|nr:2-dehydro-3-deoxygalactonokinase [Labrenzia sp. 011]PVB61800.1 2-keto-3-deoxy-galactonokinase [Labrenzia sp. 011]
MTRQEHAPPAADWIAADWGTTNLRIWALGKSGETIAHRSSEKGMGKLAPGEFEPALLELTADLLSEGRRTPVIVCGMAGSRQGWAEAPYLTTPCHPPTIGDATAVTTRDSRLDVHILPGIKQLQPADVMRGEETQIAGFLAAEPGFNGLLCLPGTHTKWVFLDGGRITAFRTFMTGELFALLSGQSVLRHGVSQKEMDPDAFSQAVRDMADEPVRFAADLFGIRAAGLIAGLGPEQARGRLSGLLIGAELAAARKDIASLPVAILGSDGLARTYRSALESLGHSARLLDADTITLQGLTLAHSSYAKVSS